MLRKGTLLKDSKVPWEKTLLLNKVQAVCAVIRKILHAIHVQEMKVNIITISGIMASGKTTLAKDIARTLEWTYLPESPLALSFIKDLFAN